MTEEDKALIEQISGRIQEEKEKHKSDEEPLFQAYPVLDDFNDNEKDVKLKKGDIVEVMDKDNDKKWLVRKQDEPSKIFYIPTELLFGKDDESSPEEEEEKEEVCLIKQSKTVGLPDFLLPQGIPNLLGYC
jgi:hypothetical protein